MSNKHMEVRKVTCTAAEDGKLTLTVHETAERLGIGRTLAWEMVRQGKIPTIRFGRRLLVPIAALEKALMDGASRPVGAR